MKPTRRMTVKQVTPDGLAEEMTTAAIIAICIALAVVIALI